MFSPPVLWDVWGESLSVFRVVVQLKVKGARRVPAENEALAAFIT